jgi:hypothetical protein
VAGVARLLVRFASAAALSLATLVAAEARANDGGGDASSCQADDGSVVTCGPSDGGVIGDGGTCAAVGGHCLAADASSGCGELLSGLPCGSGTVCCVLSSALADGAALFDSAVCVAAGSSCTPGDVCCQGSTCAPYSADGALVCGYPSLDAGFDAGVTAHGKDASVAPTHDAGKASAHDASAAVDASVHGAGGSSGCSCEIGPGRDASALPLALPLALFACVSRRRTRRAVRRQRRCP